MKALKEVSKWLVNFFTIVFFAILILIIFSKVNMLLSGKNYFELFGYSVFKVSTGSMEPAILQNDIILVKKQDMYNLNDVITFKSDDAFITHRIVQVNNDTFITKGDANNTNDKKITSDVVIGKVVKIFSGLGIWQNIFTTPKIIVSIFVTLLLFDLAFSYKGSKNILTDKKIKKVSQSVDLPVLKKIQDSSDNQLKLNQSEIKALYKKLEEISNNKNDENVVSKFDVKEKEFLEYTIRLDLSEIQKEINKKIDQN